MENDSINKMTQKLENNRSALPALHEKQHEEFVSESSATHAKTGTSLLCFELSRVFK